MKSLMQIVFRNFWTSEYWVQLSSSSNETFYELIFYTFDLNKGWNLENKDPSLNNIFNKTFLFF